MTFWPAPKISGVQGSWQCSISLWTLIRSVREQTLGCCVQRSNAPLDGFISGTHCTPLNIKRSYSICLQETGQTSGVKGVRVVATFKCQVGYMRKDHHEASMGGRCHFCGNGNVTFCENGRFGTIIIILALLCGWEWNSSVNETVPYLATQKLYIYHSVLPHDNWEMRADWQVLEIWGLHFRKAHSLGNVLALFQQWRHTTFTTRTVLCACSFIGLVVASP